MSGCKDVRYIEENHELSKGKRRWNVENLYDVRQKEENFVDGNCCDRMWNWGCESAAERYQ
jgi:hypothetical protein